MESYYRSPDSFLYATHAIDGVKFDVWCLAMMIVEALTKNYIALKSTQISLWSEQYPIIHKVLQVSEFYYTDFFF